METYLKRLADVLINYSTRVQPNEIVVLRALDDGEPLLKELFRATLAAGGNPVTQTMYDWSYHLLYKYGNDAQLDFINPENEWVVDRAEVRIEVEANRNTKIFAQLDPAREQRQRRAWKKMGARFWERANSGALRWCSVQIPTESFAQDAEMSLDEWADFVYGAMLLNDPDPVARWREMSARQQRWCDWLNGREEIQVRGANVDLNFSIRSRKFGKADGTKNFPDGEIFTSPVENSVNGWVRFTYPLNLGREVAGVEFHFENGKIVRASAAKNEDALLTMLDTDAGSRYVGEFGIGTNPMVTRYSNNTLFDEKMQGTFHLAVGNAFEEVGGKNESSVHYDIVCDLREGEMLADGEVFYRNGSFII
ncbi:MAG: aminopeptidase [Chloroflexota bacterium]|nr:MAG: aminopeptidase [Chloroflexota bacterium]